MGSSDLAIQVHAIERAITESVCRVDPTPWGVVVSNAEFPRVSMANLAWVDRWPAGLHVDDLVADVSGRFARLGVGHEWIAFTDSRLATPVQGDFVNAGFVPISDLAMVCLLQTDYPRAEGVDILEASDPPLEEACWDLAATEMRESGSAEEDVRQTIEFSRLRYPPNGVRLFLARVDERNVGYASLLGGHGMGYVGDLYTRTEDQRKGVGSSLVLRVLEESARAGNPFTGLTTRSTNTAQVMYRKLGFSVVGERRSYVRDEARTR